jgi:hypothetical protein
MVFGHIAISALLHRYLKVDLRPVVLGGIFPDAVDKTLCQGLHLTPTGRMYTHTLASLCLTTAGLWAWQGKNTALSWATGYLGHLLADSTGFVPWFYPFRPYKFYRGRNSLFNSLRFFFLKPKWLEWVFLIWAVWAFAFKKP